MDSLIRKYEKDRPLEEIKKIGYDWNQEHCQPPLDDKESDRQWESALKFITTATINLSSESILENKRYITKKINDTPEVYYYADKMEKKIGRLIINKKEKDDDGIHFTNIIIDAVPKKIFIYDNNPILEKSLERIKIIFESNTCKELEVGPYDNTDSIIKELENRHLILNKKTADEALSCIINAHKEKKIVEHLDGLTTAGYYLLNGNVKVVGNLQNISNEFDHEKIKQTITFLHFLANKGWKNKNIFPTVLKWGVVAPFSFSVKFNSEKWIPWLQLYGCGQTGKTTLGLLILQMWNLNTKTKSIGFNNIDSVARFGHQISKDTYPILVNEVGVLSTNNRYGRYASISELIKHSIESYICRGKFNEGKYHQDILALSPMIFTSNFSPPSDGALNRRFISLHFTEEEKKEQEEQDEFKKQFENGKKSLCVLGDFAAFYIRDNPSILLSKDWNNIAIEILEKFYQLVEMSFPKWIYLLEEQRDAIEDSSDNTMFDLRAFLITKINDGFSRHIRSDPLAISQDYKILDKLDYCVDNKIIPFLLEERTIH